MKTIYGVQVEPLEGVGFGCLMNANTHEAGRLVEKLEAEPEHLLSLFYSTRGLLVLRGMGEIESQPELLVRLSHVFGPEVENYRTTITTDQFFHDSIDEILVLSNLPPCRYEPPPQPTPPLTKDGTLPVSFPHRRGWHTDQSYRRPPPDVTLLLGLRCPPAGQGQTLYADCISAYETLSSSLKGKLSSLQGIHSLRWIGRSRGEVENGAKPKPLQDHQLPQFQPVVRQNPCSGRKALYLCDDEQMDFIDGPFVGMESGPAGDGADLLYKLLTHITLPEHVYVHHWCPGDLVIHDNRNMLHTATWYDSLNHARLMWRTTAMGNPGAEYTGEKKSWVPSAGTHAMEGLEDLKF